MPTIRPAPIARSNRSRRFWSEARSGLRVAVAGGYFKCNSGETCNAIDRVAAALGANRDIEIPQAAARAVRGLHHHRQRRREPASRTACAARARDFDPAVRDRLLAGAMTPASLVVKAQKFRRWYRDQVVKLFDDVDAILAPATPCTAPLIGQQTFMFGDTELPVRANLGLYTQPISFIGLPVVAVPVPLDPLPIGVQIIAAPWREDVALRLAHVLEVKGVVGRRGRRCRGRVCITAFQRSSLTPTIMRTMARTARTMASRASS